MHYSRLKHVTNCSFILFRACKANIMDKLKISKGRNSEKNVGGVTVFILCTLSDDGLYLYKVS